MSAIADSFFTQSPHKVLNKADIYAKSSIPLTQRSTISMSCRTPTPNPWWYAAWQKVLSLPFRPSQRHRLLHPAVIVPKESLPEKGRRGPGHPRQVLEEDPELPRQKRSQRPRNRQEISQTRRTVRETPQGSLPTL